MAYELNKRGYKVLVVEKRNNIAGNIYTEEVEGKHYLNVNIDYLDSWQLKRIVKMSKEGKSDSYINSVINKCLQDTVNRNYGEKQAIDVVSAMTGSEIDNDFVRGAYQYTLGIPVVSTTCILSAST